MNPIIVLDSGPLGLLMQRLGLPVADACRAWLVKHIRNGATFLVPEIADYEVRRELLRIGSTSAIQRLDDFNSAVQGRYLAITTDAMRQAADFWAQSRRQGLPTADPKELDGDVIVPLKPFSAVSPSRISPSRRPIPSISSGSLPPNSGPTSDGATARSLGR